MTVVPTRLRRPTTPPGCTSRRSHDEPATCRRHDDGNPPVSPLVGRYDKPHDTVPDADDNSGACHVHTGSPDTAATVTSADDNPGDKAG